MKFRWLATLGVAFLFLACFAVHADTIIGNTVVITSDGTAADADEINAIGPTLVIPKHPSWDGPLAVLGQQSQWVSYVFQTGDPGGGSYVVVGNTVGPEDSGTLFQDLFFLPARPLAGVLDVFADDSTSVILNGIFLMHEAPIAGNTYGTCSDDPIGCKNATIGTVNLMPALQVGWNTLEFNVAQRKSSSYGLDYAGTVEFAPEPATFILIGAGLSALGILRRKVLP